MVCDQRKNIREEALEEMFEKEVAKYTILPEFRDWALDALWESNEVESQERGHLYEMQQQALAGAQKQLDGLIDMRARDLLTDDEYLTRREKLKSEIERLRNVVDATEERADKWLDLTERVFDFAALAGERFRVGDADVKREILATIGQNLTIVGKTAYGSQSLVCTTGRRGCGGAAGLDIG